MSPALILLLTLLTACGPASAPRQSQGAGQGTEASEPAQARGPKTLTIAVLREPITFEGFTGEGGTAGGAAEMADMVHNHLTVADPFDNFHPQLAVELPSVQAGTWRVNADGSMDMTWKLRPDVKWHDGAPFTSADLMFSLQLHRDADLGHAYRRQARAMESATAPDPQTFVVHWASIDVDALQARGLTPVARHLLEEQYQTDKESFVRSSRFTSEFVGLGPYRLVTWSPGSHLELARHDQYFLGRPPLDRVIVQFIRDANAMVANILAGAVDVVLPPSVELDAALELKRRWEGTGNLVRVEGVPRLVYYELMLQPQIARPVNGLPNLQVRQGLYHAIDRPQIAEVLTAGLGPVADSWYSPGNPLRREVDSAIPQYPYDLARAQQLLAQAGWTRSSDGILTHSASGERFEMEIWSNPQTSDKSAAITADNWRAVGVDSKLYSIPPARAEDREHTAQHPGPLLTGGFLDTLLARYDGRDIASAANRWSGRNRAGYVSQRSDQLLDLLATTVDQRERSPLMREQVQLMMGELALMPLYFEPRPLLALKSVRADMYPYNPTWNFVTWDKE